MGNGWSTLRGAPRSVDDAFNTRKMQREVSQNRTHQVCPSTDPAPGALNVAAVSKMIHWLTNGYVVCETVQQQMSPRMWKEILESLRSRIMTSEESDIAPSALEDIRQAARAIDLIIGRLMITPHPEHMEVIFSQLYTILYRYVKADAYQVLDNVEDALHHAPEFGENRWWKKTNITSLVMFMKPRGLETTDSSDKPISSAVTTEKTTRRTRRTPLFWGLSRDHDQGASDQEALLQRLSNHRDRTHGMVPSPDTVNSIDDSRGRDHIPTVTVTPH